MSFIIRATGNDRNLLLISSFSLKTNNAVNQCEQCVITTAANVYSRMNLCTTLSVKDVASFYKLSVCSLGSKSLGLGITAVLCRTNSLFMSEYTEGSFLT